MNLNQISKMNGLIYLMSHESAFKVGFTTNAAKRLSHTQTHLPQKLELVLTVPGTFAAERDFHARFKSESLGNEWYPITFKPTAVEYLQNLTVEMHPEPVRTLDPQSTKRGKQVHPKSLENLKRGRSKYGVPTKSIRVPVDLLPAIRDLVDQFVAARAAFPGQPGEHTAALQSEYNRQNPSEQTILSDAIDTPPG